MMDSTEKMWEYLEKYRVDAPPNWKARALFIAIQQATTGTVTTPSTAVVNVSLIAHLAACAWVSLEYESKQVIPWNQHDGVLERAMTDFIQYLVIAIQAHKGTHLFLKGRDNRS